MEGTLLSSIRGMGKEVIELTPDQRKAFRRAVRKKTHAAFLEDNPEMSALYQQIKKNK